MFRVSERGEFMKQYESAWASVFSEMSSEGFAKTMRLERYGSVFADRFGEVAPQAWIDLLKIKPLARTWLDTTFSDAPDDEQAARAESTATAAIGEWARSRHIQVEWVLDMAMNTILVAAIRDRFEYHRPPSTLVHGVHIVYETNGDLVTLGEQSAFIHPTASAKVIVGPTEFVWDLLEETPAQLRSRASRVLEAKLEQAMKTPSSAPSPRDAVVKTHWVDYAILRYAEGWSVYKIAKHHSVSRPAVDKSIEHVRTVLGFPKIITQEGATIDK